MKRIGLAKSILVATTTLFGVGYCPGLPGTAASVVAVLIFILIKSPIYYLIFTVVSVAVAFLLSTPAEKVFGVKDCKKIVIDDFSGMLVSLLFIPKTVEFVIPAFFLFRMFDMLKVPPANKLEKLPGARGIVGDDLVAGIYANIVVQIARVALKILS